MSLTGDCRAIQVGQTDIVSDCHAAWGVYPIFARIIQGILAFVAVLLILMIFFNYHRTTGTYSEPLSIAGLAVLLQKSPLLRELSEIDSKATTSEIKSLLANKRYTIGQFTAMDNTLCYGIVPVNHDDEVGFITVQTKYTSINLSEENEETSSELILSSSHTHRLWWWVHDNYIYFLAIMVFGGTLALLSYYHWTSGDTAFERFMDSSGFSVRIMLTSLGLMISLIWDRIDSGMSSFPLTARDSMLTLLRSQNF